MEPMHTGLTIAFICNGNDHPTVINYHKFGQKYWDDTRQTIGSKIGYYFAYYFQKKFVYIHKIIDIVQPSHRPSCMDWDSDRPILCLSDQLKAFTWDEWIHGPGLNAPYTPTYSMTPTSTWSYSALQQHKKFNTFHFGKFKDIVDEIAREEDDEIARAEEIIRNAKARKAERKIEMFRSDKCNELQKWIKEEQEKILESEKRIREYTEKQLEYRNGNFDKELV
jgi:hypothetical protein